MDYLFNMPSKKLIEDLTTPECIRHILLKTVETYPNEWIVIHEALQNALDAIQLSQKETGNIQVVIDADKCTVEVTDDGKGFPFDLKLLGFGGTDKDLKELSIAGEIGVGIKTIITSSRKFELESVYLDGNEKKKWKCIIKEGYKYLEGRSEDINVEYLPPETVDKREPTYTTVRYTFPNGEHIRALLRELWDQYKNLISDDLAESHIDKFKLAIEHYFRTRGYAANVNNVIGKQTTKPIEIEVRIICGDEKLLPEVGKIDVVVKFKNRYWDVEEAVQRTRKGAPRPVIIGEQYSEFPIGGDIGKRSASYIFVYKLTDWNKHFKHALSKPKMKTPPDLNKYQKVVNQWVIGAYLVVGSREQLKRYLVGVPQLHLIAASGIPTVHEINIPRDVGALGYTNNIHLVVSVKAKASYGKQTLKLKNPRLIGWINQLFRDLFRTSLTKIAECIVGLTPEAPPPPPGPSVDIIKRKALPYNSKFSIKKEPIEELEVVALFYELIGKGYLKNYETWQLSTKEMYDGRMMVPLGGEKQGSPHSDLDLHNVEFKVVLSDLIRDFDLNRKDPNNLLLAVVWKNDCRPDTFEHERYEIIDADRPELGKWAEKRPEFVRYCIRDRATGRPIYILELRSVLKEIQEKEKSK